MNNHQCDPQRQARYGSKQFTCPDCGKRWTMAGVGPGDYWEEQDQADKDRERARQVMNELGFGDKPL